MRTYSLSDPNCDGWDAWLVINTKTCSISESFETMAEAYEAAQQLNKISKSGKYGFYPRDNNPYVRIIP